MSAYLEIRRPGAIERIELKGEQATIGRDASCEIVLGFDRTIGRAHARLERRRSGWTIRDLGVATGTSLNGRRIWSEAMLMPGDQIKVGDTTLVYDAEQTVVGITLTRAVAAPPALSDPERRVLDILCAPLVAGDIFTEPAPVAEICVSLGMTTAAVQAHLGSLYEKFGIYDEGDRRRVLLAHEAVNRGALLIIPSRSVAAEVSPVPSQQPAVQKAPRPAPRARARPKAATPKAKGAAAKTATPKAKGAAAKTARSGTKKAAAKRAGSGRKASARKDAGEGVHKRRR